MQQQAYVVFNMQLTYFKNVMGINSFNCHLNLMRQALLLFPFHR